MDFEEEIDQILKVGPLGQCMGVWRGAVLQVLLAQIGTGGEAQGWRDAGDGGGGH